MDTLCGDAGYGCQWPWVPALSVESTADRIGKRGSWHREKSRVRVNASSASLLTQGAKGSQAASSMAGFHWGCKSCIQTTRSETWLASERSTLGNRIEIPKAHGRASGVPPRRPLPPLGLEHQLVSSSIKDQRTHVVGDSRTDATCPTHVSDSFTRLIETRTELVF